MTHPAPIYNSIPSTVALHLERQDVVDRRSEDVGKVTLEDFGLSSKIGESASIVVLAGTSTASPSMFGAPHGFVVFL